MHNIVSPKCSWGNFEQFKVHVSSRQKKKMVKSADFDGNMSIFWLKYILHMVLLHTRWLVSMGIFVLPFGPILSTVSSERACALEEMNPTRILSVKRKVKAHRVLIEMAIFPYQQFLPRTYRSIKSIWWGVVWN